MCGALKLCTWGRLLMCVPPKLPLRKVGVEKFRERKVGLEKFRNVFVDPEGSLFAYRFIFALNRLIFPEEILGRFIEKFLFIPFLFSDEILGLLVKFLVAKFLLVKFLFVRFLFIALSEEVFGLFVKFPFVPALFKAEIFEGFLARLLFVATKFLLPPVLTKLLNEFESQALLP